MHVPLQLEPPCAIIMSQHHPSYQNTITYATLKLIAIGITKEI
jgi:hypothetical protein